MFHLFQKANHQSIKSRAQKKTQKFRNPTLFLFGPRLLFWETQQAATFRPFRPLHHRPSADLVGQLLHEVSEDHPRHLTERTRFFLGEKKTSRSWKVKAWKLIFSVVLYVCCWWNATLSWIHLNTVLAIAEFTGNFSTKNGPWGWKPQFLINQPKERASRYTVINNLSQLNLTCVKKRTINRNYQPQRLFWNNITIWSNGPEKLPDP